MKLKADSESDLVVLDALTLVKEDRWLVAVPDLHQVINMTLGEVSKVLEVMPGEISLVLSNNDFIQSLNKAYRHKDAPTNVLSFPAYETFADDFIDDGEISYGDVVLAYETVCLEALDQNKEVCDHMVHLIVHGVLHLFSYDHFDEISANKMEGLEKIILDRLNIKDPYV